MPKKIKFIRTTAEMEYQIGQAFKQNFEFADVLIPLTTLLPFEFPSYLQSEDFYIDKLTFNYATNASSWTQVFKIDNTYKNTNYFEGYTYAVPLVSGFYRIRAGSYNTYNLLKAINVGEFIRNFRLINSSGQALIDASGDFLTQPI